MQQERPSRWSRVSREHKTPSASATGVMTSRARMFLSIVVAAVALAESTCSRVPIIQGGSSSAFRLQAGRSESYRLHAFSGKRIRLVAEQKGIDVALTIRAPDGTVI